MPHSASAGEKGTIPEQGQISSTVVHLSAQAKGGIGKSLVATLLAQYLSQKGPVRCFDTDPLNATFAGFQSLGVRHFQIAQANVIDDRTFDGLVESLCGDTGPFVIDTGATAFIPFWNYVLENRVIDALQENERTLKIHCVVAGGQAMRDNFSGLHSIAAHAPAASIIVWVNQFFGPVQTLDGKTFEHSELARAHASKIGGIVYLKERSRTTFGVDIRQMLEQRLTLAEAIEQFPLMAKMRLRQIRDDVFAQLEGLRL